MEQEEEYMRGALRLAAYGRGRTSPNPMVGAVLVRDGRVVGMGWHRKAGTEHAEIHALRMAGELAKGATLYVTLEPCAHQGWTGPCARALVKAGISRAVVAMEDPNPLVAGKGMEILKAAGIAVSCGLLEKEARALNEIFLKWITTHQPFVLLKTAMSLDGKIATSAGKSRWISNARSRQRAHELRDCYDGIMVGIGTVLADDPSLTTRLPDGNGKNPLRIVVDSKAQTPLSAKVLTDGKARTLVAVTSLADPLRVAAIRDLGNEVLTVNDGPNVDVKALMTRLGEKNLCSILVEGGATLNFSLLKAGLVDRICAFIAPKLIGGKNAPTAVGGIGFSELTEAVELQDIQLEMLDGDLFYTALVRK